MPSSESNGQEPKLEHKWLNVAISLVQPLGIVVGGCWIAFLYFTYQEKADDASLKEKQLSIEQAQIVLQTQEQSNKLDVDLKKMSLDQASIALETQRNEKELKSAQLATEVELKRQEVVLNQLREKQQAHDVEYSNSYRSSHEMSLQAVRTSEVSKQPSDYRVSLSFTLKNESTVDYEVSYMAVEYYLGALQDSGLAHGDVVFAPIGTPPSLVNSMAKSGALEWSSLGPPAASVGVKLLETWALGTT